MDILFIEKMVVMSSIGVYDWEKKCLQKLIFDLYLAYDTKCIANNESTLNYIDYTCVHQTILDLMNKQHFYLIENVANTMANVLMEKFNVFWVRIKISKPGAISDVENIGVCIERKNKMFI